MTVKELKEKLSQYDESLPLCVYDQHFESTYRLAWVQQEHNKVRLEFWAL
jgi:4-hydroxy-3-methylbut-2-en-1-yl diphosphate synthase IspG/GcpE